MSEKTVEQMLAEAILEDFPDVSLDDEVAQIIVKAFGLGLTIGREEIIMEYKVLECPHDKLEEVLNNYRNQGWRLHTAQFTLLHSFSHTWTLIFERTTSHE